MAKQEQSQVDDEELKPTAVSGDLIAPDDDEDDDGVDDEYDEFELDEYDFDDDDEGPCRCRLSAAVLTEMRQLSDEQILAKLRDLGAEWNIGDLTPESFREAVTGSGGIQSVYSFLREFGDFEVSDEPDDKVAALVFVLWERWLPEEPFTEQLQELAGRAKKALEDKNFEASVESWTPFWAKVLDSFKRFEIPGIDEVDMVFELDCLMYENLECFEEALFEAGKIDAKYWQQLVQLADDLSPYLTDALDLELEWGFRKARALFGLGNADACDQLIEELIDNCSNTPTTWVQWAEIYEGQVTGSPNWERAEAIIRRGMEIEGHEKSLTLLCHLRVILEGAGDASRLAEIQQRISAEEEAIARSWKEKYSQSMGPRIVHHSRAPVKATVPPKIVVPNKPTEQFLSEKLGRNDPCICGSGKKFKKCCGR